MADVIYVTGDGLQKLKDELDQLRNIERPSISRQIAEARDKGDLSENAEYDAAKEEQGLFELKIAKLEDILSRARSIDTSQFEEGKVHILSKVKIKNLKNSKMFDYLLVSPEEADFQAGKISITSPVGKGLLNTKVGDKVKINAPAGLLEYEIIEIS